MGVGGGGMAVVVAGAGMYKVAAAERQDSFYSKAGPASRPRLLLGSICCPAASTSSREERGERVKGAIV